jgi:hypothetical protein
VGLLFAVTGVMLVAIAALGAIAIGWRTGPDPAPDTATRAPASASGVPEVQRPARPTGPGAAQPTALLPVPPERLVIPSIGVNTDLEKLHLDGDGKLAPPGDFDHAGWFVDGTQPGQPGPAIIAGHVDSKRGPAVFAHLDRLAPGDQVIVVRIDGSKVRFRVTDTQSYPKKEFPTAAVYGPVPDAQLRLVTCDGAFDRSIGHYLDNRVVYATLVGAPALG